MANQFYYPVLTQSWTEKLLLFEILLLFNASLFLKMFSKRINADFILLLILSILGANYFSSGLRKIDISPNLHDWITHNRMYYLTVLSHELGWLNFLSPRIFASFINLLRTLNIPLQIFALIIELGGISILWSKRSTIAALIYLPILNILIFAVCGLFFWEWIILNVFLLILMLRIPINYFPRLYNVQYMIVSVLLILTARIGFFPVKLGWYDLKLMDHFKIEIVNDQGVTKTLDPSMMSLYDYFFDNGLFCFLIDEPLVSCDATTDKPSFAREINNLSVDQVDAFKKRRGENYFDAKKIDNFDQFLMIYFKNYNGKIDHTLWFSKFMAPRHVHRDLSWNTTWMNEVHAVRSVKIHFIENIYDDDKNEVIVLRDRIVDEVTIP